MQPRSVVTACDEEAGVVAAVVAHFEGRYLEVADLEGKFLVDGTVVVLDPARYAVAAQEALENARGAVHADVLVFAHERVDIAHVVAVVVCEADSFHVVHGEAVFFQGRLHFVGFNSRVDQYAAL